LLSGIDATSEPPYFQSMCTGENPGFGYVTFVNCASMLMPFQR
jgi:hypothetical protein